MSASRFDATVPRLGPALGWLLALWQAPGVVAAVALLLLFEQSATGAILHSVVLLALLQTLLLPSMAELLDGRWQRWQQWLTAWLLATVQLALLAFYAGSAVGHRYWGNWLTLDLGLAYVPQLPGLLTVLEVSPWLASAAVALLWIGLVSVFQRAVCQVAVARAALPASVSRRLGLALLVGLLATLALLYRSWYIDYRYWRGEPLRQASLSTGHGQAGISTLVSAERLERERLAGDAYQRIPALVTPRPLVLIIVDALRSDVMGVYGAPVDNTPFLSSLFRSGALRKVDDAYSVCTSSYCGILGVLASKHWFELTPQPWNIADALKRHGYESRFLLSGDHTSFFGLRRMFGESVQLMRDGSDQSLRYANDDRIVLDALDETGWPKDKPGFLYVHLMSAHRLGLQQPELRRWNENNTPIYSRFETPDPAEQPQSHARYHNGIRQSDAMIEQIFARLAQLKVLDDALVVITADHGEHLGETGRWSHGNLPFEPGVRIPLLVYDRQGRSAWPARTLVSQTDIAPTLLQAVGAPIPETWSGVPLQREAQRSSLIVESSEATGLVHDAGQGRFKYLRLRTKAQEQLFQIHPAGGAENVDLAALPQYAGLLTRLRAEHDRLRRP